MRLGKRTYKVKCPDGTTRIVHRDVDDAFPLAIKDTKGRMSALLKDLNGDSLGIDGELSRGVSGLLFELNERNDTAMMNFRATYVAFQANPCSHADRLARRVDEMTAEQQQLARTRQELTALIDLAVATPADADRIWQTFGNIVARTGGLPGVPQATAARMRAARKAALGWIGHQQ
jgi:hypothetical protein